MLGAIPNHNSAIRAHGGNDVGVLWLIPRLVDFTLVVNLLDNVELDLHRWLLGATSISTNLTLVLIVVFGIWGVGIGELHLGDLKVVLRITSSMRPNQ